MKIDPRKALASVNRMTGLGLHNAFAARWIAIATVIVVATPSARLTAQAARSNIQTATPAGGTARAGDVIRVNVWREPDLSGDFTIDETGTVVLPRIGPIDVTRDSRSSLRRKLLQDYDAFLNHSSVTITVLRRVRVLGAVRNPGLFMADGTMTLGDVLAQAGGVTPDGNADRVRLIRGGERLTANMAIETLLSDSPVLSGDEIFVPMKRWVSRYPGIAAAGITAAATLVVALTRHR